MDATATLEFNGRLAPFGCAEILAEINQAGFTGSLKVSQEKQKAILYFESGALVFAVSNARKHRLFELLLRHGAVERKEILSIENFTNDLFLSKSLVEAELLSQDVVDSVFGIQIKQILQEVLRWDSGAWEFSPLAKIREDIKFDINLSAQLGRYSNTLGDEEIIARFKSMSEVFAMNVEGVNSSTLDPTPESAFLLSRIGNQSVTIEELRTLSGMENDVLFPSLYRLWLGGFVVRSSWNSYFSAEATEKIKNVRLTLKQSASSVDEGIEKLRLEKEEAERAKEQALKEEKELKETARAASGDIDLDAYLERVDDAATHYEIFGVQPEEKIAAIKKVYFTYAKKFHPDKFHNSVDEDKLRRIQDSFTAIAKAYETLKDKEARELYDFKLRKVLEAAKTNGNAEGISKGDFESHKKKNEAVTQFDKGFELLEDGYIGDSLPYLERATKLEPGNPRFHAYLGKALSFDKKKRHRAEQEMQLAVKLDKHNTQFRYMLAELYVEIGLAARAKGELKRLLEKDPEDKEAKSLLDRLDRK